MRLRRTLLQVFALSFFLSIALGPLFAQAGLSTHERQDLVRTVKLPLEQWLEHGEHTEIAWKVSLSRPALTYQLRSLVRVTAEIPVDLLQKESIAHDLHFIVKAAPERGSWNTEESYSRFRVEAKLDPRSELQMLAELYLQPGHYTIATIAYDATSGKRNLAFNRVQVGDADSEPFPELLAAVPKIQFLAPPDEAAPLGEGRVSLSVATQRPVQLSLILDLSTHQEEVDDVGLLRPGYHPYPPYPRDPEWRQSSDARRDSDRRTNQEIYEQSQLLQSAALLSQIDLKQGCVRVVAFDVLRQRTLLPPTSAAEVEWDKIRGELLSPDRTMVTVGDLKGRRDAARFFEQELERTMTQPLSCKLAFPNPLKVIVVLSRGISFPSGSDRPRIRPRSDCKVFYLQQTDRESGTDLRNLLRPLSPVVLEFGNPQDFRQKLLEFTRAMERLP